ncbi:hypothetical protein [Mycolicibacterium doricum]|uniref:hypothetical protein n=1 Tax=Mycolicibacterium doricum TaxID=126673 RepID=UPI001FD47752|nr:hypothetical protein [Mycolicibacterium doricum]
MAEAVTPEGTAVAQQIVRLDLGAHVHTELVAYTASELQQTVESLRPCVGVDQHATERERHRPAVARIARIPRFIDVRDEHAGHPTTP